MLAGRALQRQQQQRRAAASSSAAAAAAGRGAHRRSPAPQQRRRDLACQAAGVDLSSISQEYLIAGGAALAALAGLVGYAATNPEAMAALRGADGAAGAGAAAAAAAGAAPDLPPRVPRDNAVLVLGATGRLGRKVVEALVRSGRTVVAAARSADKAGAAFAEVGLSEGLRAAGGAAGSGALVVEAGVDVTDAATLTAGLFEGVTQVVSCLGPVVGRTPDGGFGILDGMSSERVEAGGLANVIAAIKQHAPALLEGARAARAAPPTEVVLPMRTADDLAVWDRLDDVIMGGSSSSGLAPAAASGSNGSGDGSDGGSDVAVWRGDLVVEGGGFCGARTKALNLDLSRYDGLALRVRGDGSTYKFNIKTADQEDTPESTYQTTFDTDPSGDWTTAYLPWASFVPVKRAQSDPDGAPLDARQVSKLGLVLSRFEFNKAPNPRYTPGKFALEIAGGVRAFTAPRPAVVLVSSAGVERNAAIGDDAAKRAADIPIVRLNPNGVLNWKYVAECELRASGIPYAVVRCTGLDDRGDDEAPALLEADQGDAIEFAGRVTRKEAAAAIAAALSSPDSAYKTFELRRSEAAGAQGRAMTPRAFNRLFVRLARDEHRWRVGLMPMPRAVPPPPPPSEEEVKSIVADPRVQAARARDIAARDKDAQQQQGQEGGTVEGKKEEVKQEEKELARV